MTILSGQTLVESAAARRVTPVAEILDWTFKALGVVSAILFGVWAPMGYVLAREGNASNDEAQNALLEELKAMRKEQKDMLEVMHRMAQSLYGLGEFRVWDHCRRHPVVSPLVIYD